jgi:hypothetical protein
MFYEQLAGGHPHTPVGGSQRPYWSKGRGYRLTARFSAVDLAITADALDREELDRLIEIADRGCIMMNTLRDKLTLSIVVAMTVWPRRRNLLSVRGEQLYDDECPPSSTDCLEGVGLDSNN